MERILNIVVPSVVCVDVCVCVCVCVCVWTCVCASALKEYEALQIRMKPRAWIYIENLHRVA